MKTAVIFSDGIKQVILTPENDQEIFALSLITPADNIELLSTEGSMFDSRRDMEPFSATISELHGGYLRVYSNAKSRILVLKPKKEDV